MKSQKSNTTTEYSKPNATSIALAFNQTTINNAQQSPSYLHLYGLREAPFSQDLNDKFYFLDTDHAQRLRLINKLILDPNLFLHISGISGVGKTSFINHFVKLAEDNWRFSIFTANSIMTSEQLYFNVSSGFGLNAIPVDNRDLKDICVENVALLEASGEIPILIIDDVHELPLDSLKSIFKLVNRWDKNHPKLRVIIISNPEFKTTLTLDDFKSECSLISEHMEIEVLSDEQIKRYIYFRLSIAGVEGGGTPITHAVCSDIVEQSHGIPKKVNSLCHIALVNGIEHLTRENFFDGENFNFPLRKYLITGSFMAIFLGLIFGFFEPDSQQHDITVVDSKKMSKHKNNIIDKAQVDNNSITQTKIEIKAFTIYDFSTLEEKTFISNIRDKNANTITSIMNIQFELTVAAKRKNVQAKKIKNISIKKLNDNSGEKNKTTKKPVKIVTNNLLRYDINKLTTITSKDFPEIISITPRTLTAKNKEITISLYGQNFSKKSSITFYGVGGAREIPEYKISHVSDSQINVKLVPRYHQGQNWIVVTNPITGKSNSKLYEITSLSRKYMEDTQWILAQKSNKFVLHLMGSKYKKSLIKFASEKQVTGQYAVFKTNRKGVGWYHLILGPYKNKESAKLAVRKLPQKMVTPWIRPIKDIQKVIRRFKSIPTR